MTASARRPVDGSSLSRENEELDRIAGMSDDELVAHLSDSGVDVTALDEQVDSIRGQVESIRGQIVASGMSAFESGPDSWTRPWPVSPRSDLDRRRRLMRLLAVCVVALLAVVGGAALSSLLR
jgi:hypothetical protein